MGNEQSFRAVGVDGCRTGWICAAWDGESWSLQLLPRLSDLLPWLAPAATICIDIPIGLSRNGVRACDREARQLLGPRRSSVFPVPPRLALEPASYAAINAASKKHFERGVSKQAFYLLPKIRETEALLSRSDVNGAAWMETHPELCFAGLNGGVPMQNNKKSEEGNDERIMVLERFMGGVLIHDLVAKFCAKWPRSSYQRDDVIDALVCGVVAKLQPSQRLFLPATGPEYDDTGLPMRICYPRSGSSQSA